MQSSLTGSPTSDELTEVAEDFWRRIRPEERTIEVVVGLVIAVLVPKTVCWPPVGLVVVFLYRRELSPPSFPLRFRFLPTPAIVQDSKFTSIYSIKEGGRANRERKLE